MLSTKLLRVKKIITNLLGESITDLISSTFKFGETNISAGPSVVSEYEVMRPDLLADRVYASQDNWDALLKFNGISNPFSLNQGEVLLVPAPNELSKMIVPPRTVLEKGNEPTKKNEDAVIKPKSIKDKKRLESIRTKVSEVVPPNVNLTGVQNVKVVNGKVILGGDMTQSSSTDTNQSSTRNRVQDQLKNKTGF